MIQVTKPIPEEKTKLLVVFEYDAEEIGRISPDIIDQIVKESLFHKQYYFEWLKPNEKI